MLFCPNAHPTSSKYDKNLHVSERAFCANCTCLHLVYKHLNSQIVWHQALTFLCVSLVLVPWWQAPPMSGSNGYGGFGAKCSQCTGVPEFVPILEGIFVSHWLTTNEIPEAIQKISGKNGYENIWKYIEILRKLHVWCLLHWPIRGVVAATVWLGPTQFLRQRPCF